MQQTLESRLHAARPQPLNQRPGCDDILRALPGCDVILNALQQVYHRTLTAWKRMPAAAFILPPSMPQTNGRLLCSKAT